MSRARKMKKASTHFYWDVERVRYEPNMRHAAWSGLGTRKPTFTSHPDAFTAVREVVSRRPEILVTRISPHRRLSKRSLAKRLYRAGLKGAELREIRTRILAGQAEIEYHPGVNILGWNLDVFQRIFGRMVMRRALNFVQQNRIFSDEQMASMAAGSHDERMAEALKITGNVRRKFPMN